jgi:DNA-binding transcriptional LysR family regulator
MINSNDLKSFIVVAQTLHLTKAAKELGMSQPALSHCIKRLEIDLNEVLFLRRKDGLILTRAGQILLGKGKKICDELESVKKLLQSEEDRSKLSLSLGLHTSVASYTLPDLLKKASELTFQFHFGLSREVNQWIQEGKIECGVVINPYPHPNLIINVLSKDNFNLWSHKKKKNLDRVFINSELHQTHSLIRQAEKKGYKFGELIEIPNLELIAKLVYEGAGVGIVPEKVIKNFNPQDTVLFSEKIKPFIDQISFVYSEENRSNKSILKTKELLTQVLK